MNARLDPNAAFCLHFSLHSNISTILTCVVSYIIYNRTHWKQPTKYKFITYTKSNQALKMKLTMVRILQKRCSISSNFNVSYTGYNKIYSNNGYCICFRHFDRLKTSFLSWTGF